MQISQHSKSRVSLSLVRATLLVLAAFAFLGAGKHKESRESPKFEVTDLGAVRRLAADLAPGLNSKGDVVIWRQSESMTFAPVLWTSGQAKRLDIPSGYHNGFAYAVNDSGNAVGWANAALNPVDSFSLFHAVMLSERGATDLGTLGGRWSRAYAINNHDVIVGLSEMANKRQLAFQYEKGKMSELPPPGSGTFSIAFALNDSGTVVGGADVPHQGSKMMVHAVLWRHGVPEDLGSLSPDGNSLAYAINNQDEVVGKSDVGPDETAFLYSGGRMTDLGMKGGRALGINDKRQIVGIQKMGERHPHVAGFLWENGTFYDLNQCLPKGSLYFIDGAFGINNAGQIVAIGVSGSEMHALLLTPVKPKE